MLIRQRKTVLLILLLPLTVLAGSINLSAPHDGGGDALWCGGVVEPGNSTSGRKGEQALFVSDEQSEISDAFRHGFVVMGIDDKDIRLRAPAGAHLIIGGEFASTDAPRTLLRVTPVAVDEIKDAMSQEESFISTRVKFEVIRGTDRLHFRGAVFCSVYDFDSFAKNICPSPASSTAQPLACKAMRAAILNRPGASAPAASLQ